MKIRATFPTAAAALFFAALDASAQCAMCREALENNAKNGGSTLQQGLSYAILLMLGLVFIVIPSGFAFAIWRSYRKAPRRPPSPLPPGSPAAPDPAP